MPNRKVKGACWYRSDSEWGDVVYDDTDIIAWMPLLFPSDGYKNEIKKELKERMERRLNEGNQSYSANKHGSK